MRFALQQVKWAGVAQGLKLRSMGAYRKEYEDLVADKYSA